MSNYLDRCKKNAAIRITLMLVSLMLIGVLASCSQIEKIRSISGAAIAIQHKVDLEALKQVEIERQRARKARCYSPLLTPAALSAAAEEPLLGQAWIEELLVDCPAFSAFLSNLVILRARDAGLSLQ